MRSKLALISNLQRAVVIKRMGCKHRSQFGKVCCVLAAAHERGVGFTASHAFSGRGRDRLRVVEVGIRLSLSGSTCRFAIVAMPRRPSREQVANNMITLESYTLTPKSLPTAAVTAIANTPHPTTRLIRSNRRRRFSLQTLRGRPAPRRQRPGSSSKAIFSLTMSASSISDCEETQAYSPAAIDIAPAVIPATPAINAARGEGSADATPTSNDAMDTIQSFAP